MRKQKRFDMDWGNLFKLKLLIIIMYIMKMIYIMYYKSKSSEKNNVRKTGRKDKAIKSGF